MIDGFAENDVISDRIDTWLLESYSLHNICEVEEGDIVLDCGTYSGNTTLYFANKAGNTGHVYGFEAHPKTFKNLRKNVAHLQNCTPIRAAVATATGMVCFDENATTASSIQKKGIQVPALSLNDFINSHKIINVDFIKMDIEGCEADALRGADRIISMFHPKMAISVYHKLEDLYFLPQLIHSINRDYIFYLRHYSDNKYETVLFCVPTETAHSEDLCIAETFQKSDIYKLTTLLHAIYTGYHDIYSPWISEYKKLLREYQNASEYLHKSIKISECYAEKIKQIEAENHRLKSIVTKFSAQIK
ncbi:MAG: FkbM family methyltransferase [Desulfovibrio sp.]|jgi:FkbM family methyltransferase|nr:FkbM family methyltransferase [Desulfovibrio sp.]